MLSAAAIVASRCAIDDRRSVFGQPSKRILNLGLGMGVERTGGLVKDQYFSITQHRASNGETLFLTTGKVARHFRPLANHIHLACSR